jgi:dihydrolipoamide dehydrogenase
VAPSTPAPYDVLVIGGGPAGYVAAIRAAQLGLRTICVERERLGGICLNWGCIPTKALLRSAEVLHLVQNAADYGVLCDNPRIDFSRIISRSRQVAEGRSKGIDFLFKKYKVESLPGTAQLAGRGKATVRAAAGTRTIEAKHTILATGAGPRGLPGIEPDGKQILTYREAMSLPERPRSLCIIGAGAIGAEFASFYHALGTEVHLLEALPRILPLEDEEVSQTVERSFKKRGIKVRTGVKVTGAKPDASGVTVTVEGESLRTDKLLVSVGVRANTAGFGLEAVGVKLTDRGFIQVDADYKTTAPGVHAIGDCAGPPLLAHKAMQEGIVCVETIAGKRSHRVDYASIPSCTYSSPEVASVGLSERAAREKGLEIKVGKFPFAASGKAHAAGEVEGFVKAVVDAKHGEILGVHMVGAHVTDLIIEPGLAKTSEATAHEIMATAHAHPTLSEAVQEAIANALGEAIHI